MAYKNNEIPLDNTVADGNNQIPLDNTNPTIKNERGMFVSKTDLSEEYNSTHDEEQPVLPQYTRRDVTKNWNDFQPSSQEENHFIH